MIIRSVHDAKMKKPEERNMVVLFYDSSSSPNNSRGCRKPTKELFQALVKSTRIKMVKTALVLLFTVA
jgi:hypothetical protein